MSELARFREIFDELMRFAVQHFVAALHGEPRERFGTMTLAGTRRSDTQDVFFRVEELQRAEFQHVAFRQARVVTPVKRFQVFAFA